MHRRRILLTGITIAGALAGCAGDDGTGETDQPGGNAETTQAGGPDETTQAGGGGETTLAGGPDETTQAGGGGETTQAGGGGETTQADGGGETTQAGGGGETTQPGDSTTELTGTETYSGEWSGSIGGQSYSGEWQFEANFDDEQVQGKFWGDGEGDITGTVSGRELNAEGGAAFGTVEWSGEFSNDGQEISGTWELADDDIPSSGTWSGSPGESTNQEE